MTRPAVSSADRSVMSPVAAFRTPSLQALPRTSPGCSAACRARHGHRAGARRHRAAPSTGCRNVGKTPTLSAIEDPTAQPGYKPVQMPMPTPEPRQLRLRTRSGARARAPSSRTSARARSATSSRYASASPTRPASTTPPSARAPSNEKHGDAEALRLRDRVLKTSCPTAVDPDSLVDTSKLSRIRRRAPGSVTPLGGTGHQRRRGRHPGPAQRQPRDRGQAGNPRQLRGARADRRRRDPAGGHRAPTTPSNRPRSPRRASPMAAAARSPTSSSRATASRSWTSCCRSEASPPSPGRAARSPSSRDAGPGRRSRRPLDPVVFLPEHDRVSASPARPPSPPRGPEREGAALQAKRRPRKQPPPGRGPVQSSR